MFRLPSRWLTVVVVYLFDGGASPFSSVACVGIL